MAQNNEDGRFGEIANQAGVVIQTQQDMKDIGDRCKLNGTPNVLIYPGAPATTDNTVVRVDVNDLVFTVGYNNGGSGGIMNNAIPVSSNCNGLFIYNGRLKFPLSDPNDEEETIQALSETIRVIGQALGGTNPLPDSPSQLKTNFTTRAQGSAHITNTGSDVINPGDMVLWDLFRKDEIFMKNSNTYTDNWKNRMARFGFNMAKVPLKLVKLSHAHVSFEKSLKEEIIKCNTVGKKASRTAQGRFANHVIDFVSDVAYLSLNTNVNKKDKLKARQLTRTGWSKNANLLTDIEHWDDSINHFIEGIMYMVNDLERRKVGKALSFSKPGKGLDILLGAT